MGFEVYSVRFRLQYSFVNSWSPRSTWSCPTIPFDDNKGFIGCHGIVVMLVLTWWISKASLLSLQLNLFCWPDQIKLCLLPPTSSPKNWALCVQSDLGTLSGFFLPFRRGKWLPGSTEIGSPVLSSECHWTKDISYLPFWLLTGNKRLLFLPLCLVDRQTR